MQYLIISDGPGSSEPIYALMTDWLRERGLPAASAESAARDFLDQLHRIGLYRPSDADPISAPDEQRAVDYYRIWRTTMRVITNDRAVARTVDRICRQFRVDPTDDAVEFEVRRCAEHGWHVEREGRRLATEDSASDAATELEYPMIDTSVLNERAVIHRHGSGLARHGRAVLIPGQGRASKTTLSLAMTEHGFRLMGDDVLFLDPAKQLVHPVHRAVLLRKGAEPELRRTGLRLPKRTHRVGNLLPVDVIQNWEPKPARLAMVLLVDWDEAGPVEVMEIGQAEAAVEIRRFSHNLKRRRDGGWPPLAEALRGVRCFRLLRSQDLAAASAAIRDLLDETGAAAPQD